MSIIILTEEELKALQEKSEYDFTLEDALVVIEHWEIFKKLINKASYNIQLDLWKWVYQWRETQAYAAIDWIKKVWTLVDTIKAKIQEYQQTKKDEVAKEILSV